MSSLTKIKTMETTDRILYARQCDITKEGMNEGYCIEDGLMYIKYEKDMIKHLREKDKDMENIELMNNVFSKKTTTDKELLDIYYENEYYYWTEWEWEDEDELQYEEIDGKLIEINN